MSKNNYEEIHNKPKKPKDRRI